MPEQDAWAKPRTVDHTFSTGRPATLRATLPTSQLVRDGVWDAALDEALNLAVAGELDDPVVAVRLFDAVVMGMFVDPRIVPDDEVDFEARRYPLGVLDESEILETIKAAFGGAVADATFPGHAADESGEGGGEVVRDAAEPSARPRAGKSGGARRRPASGGGGKQAPASAA